MGNVRCARCGGVDDEASASFTEDGLVCASCALGEQRRDQRQMNEQWADAGRVGGRPAATLLGSSSSSQSEHAPASPAYLELTARGATVARQTLRERTEVMGVVSESSGYSERWTLTAPSAIRARFTREGLGTRVGKLFSKELETGDRAFDELVYIRTDTADSTRAFLADDSVRALVRDVVASGGSLSIAGTTVEGSVYVPSDQTAPFDILARLALAAAGS
jgi:hypothetical protein